MSIKKVIFIFSSIAILVLIYIFVFQQDEVTSNNFVSVATAMSSENDSAYEVASLPKEFDFPADYGAHNKFKLEWWYFTGNLSNQNGENFGYQFTIFRNALSPDSSGINSTFSSNQLYFAHFGLTDISNGKHYYFEKFARGVKGLAGAEPDPMNIYIENWNIKATYPDGNYLLPHFSINAEVNGVSIALDLLPEKGMVLHGDRGLSPKSSEPGNASYYYSFTRLKTIGSIKIAEKRSDVVGLSWMDREWSTSALSKNQVGWDWFSIQLSDSTELMLFRLRDSLGESDFSKGTIVLPNGNSVKLESSDFDLKVIESNKLSSGISYPSKWNIKIPKYDIELICDVRVPDQEMKLSVKYYEGSITVKGRKKDRVINGSGYVELTGYENKKL